MTFNQIVQKYDVSRNYLFHFFQIRDYIKEKPSLLTDFNVPDIEKRMFCTVGDTSISVLYNILRNYSAVGFQELTAP